MTKKTPPVEGTMEEPLLQPSGTQHCRSSQLTAIKWISQLIARLKAPKGMTHTESKGWKKPLLKCGLFVCLFYVLLLITILPLLWKIYENYVYNSLDEFVDTIGMDDPVVAAFLRERFLVQTGTSLQIELPALGASHTLQHLEQQKGGFYIECGCEDGKRMSESLFLEATSNWTGLVIEPDAALFRHLERTRTLATISRSCLSVKPYPHTEATLPPDEDEPLPEEWSGVVTGGRVSRYVQCFPLYTYLLALGRMRVDLLSLDMKGWEVEVLVNIPWDLVNIRVVSVRQHVGWHRPPLPNNKNVLQRYMRNKGYTVFPQPSFFPLLSTTTTVFVKE